MIRKFRVLKDMIVNVGYGYSKIVPSNTIIRLSNLGIINGFNSFWCNEYNFAIKDIKTVLSLGYLEEVKSADGIIDKKLEELTVELDNVAEKVKEKSLEQLNENLVLTGCSTNEFADNLNKVANMIAEKTTFSNSEVAYMMSEELKNKSNSILDYEKKYNIYEILTLIPNLPKDTKFKCSLQDSNVWEYNNINSTLLEVNKNITLEEMYFLKDILEATYMIIKPQEEKVENWVEIETPKQLCTAIVNKKMIKVGDGKPTNEYNDNQIETLFGALEHGVFKIECKEE